MSNKVIIQTVDVSTAGEQIHFQLNIPEDAKRITGIFVTENTSYTHGDTDPVMTVPKSQLYYDNIKVGRLRLNVGDTMGSCHTQEIIRNDNSLAYGDFDQLDLYDDYLLYYNHDWWFAGRKAVPFMVEIKKGNTVLSGFYEDFFMADREASTDYQVTVYIHYETKEK